LKSKLLSVEIPIAEIAFSEDGKTGIAGVLSFSMAKRNLVGTVAVWSRWSGNEQHRIEMEDGIRKLKLSPAEQ
jgi:hypothetical protein